VASALKNVGKTMRGQTVDEDDVEERVSHDLIWLTSKIAEAKKTLVLIAGQQANQVGPPLSGQKMRVGRQLKEPFVTLAVLS
jgi:hypothetical protein